jgi:hypothetical protein
MTQRMDYIAATPAGVKALGGVYGHIMQSGLPEGTGQPRLPSRLADQRLRLLHRHAFA